MNETPLTPDPHTFLVLSGPAGPSLYLDDYRIAGPKPWGGAIVLHTFHATDADLRAARVSDAARSTDELDADHLIVAVCDKCHEPVVLDDEGDWAHHTSGEPQ